MMTAAPSAPPAAGPTPKPRSLTMIVVAIAVVAVAVLLALVFVVPALTTPQAVPEVHLSIAPSGQYLRAQVVSASRAEPPSYYRVNMTVNGVRGTSAPMPATANATVHVTANGTVYGIAWVDADHNGTLTTGDSFLVSYVSGAVPPFPSTYTFWLLTSGDGAVASATWSGGTVTTKPVVTFSSPTVSGSNCTFTVAGASQQVVLSSFEINLIVNGTSAGTPVTLTSSGTMSITVAGHAYSVTYVDISGNGLLKSGDQFRVAGLQSSMNYQFVLLWAADGSLIQSVSWTMA